MNGRWNSWIVGAAIPVLLLLVAAEGLVGGTPAMARTVGNAVDLHAPRSGVGGLSTSERPVKPGDGAEVTPQHLGTVKGAVGAGATAVNDRGQVVGNSLFDYTRQVVHPFFWEKGRIRDLGTFGGRSAEALDINEAGQILISTLHGDETGPMHAFIWHRGRTIDIGSLGTGGYPIMINNRGQVIATRYTSSSGPHAVLWSSGRLVDLGLLPGGKGAYAFDINDRGDVVGVAFDAEEHYQAVIWPRGRPGPIPLGVGGSLSIAINNRGQVAVTTERIPDQGAHAALWWRGRVVAQVKASSVAMDINDLGVIAGLIQDIPEQTPFQAMVWKRGHVTILPRPAWSEYSSVQRINNRNQILGFAAISSFTRYQSIVWQHGNAIALGPLPNEDAGYAASDINEHGQVPGESDFQDARGNLRAHAVLWTVPLDHRPRP